MNEDERLSSLNALAILDTAPEAEFDALVRAASMVCDTPISLISLIDRDRQWFKANVGLPDASQTERGAAFCAHAIHGSEIFEVPDATMDARFRDNSLVTGAPDIRFYAGAPLVLSDGSNVGTLCVIDREPRLLTEQQREILLYLAQTAVKALEGRRAAMALHDIAQQLREAHEALQVEHDRRSDFLATLSHELRNPLAALKAATQMLKLSKNNWERVEKVTGMYDRQVAHMVRLVDDLSDASRVAAGKIQLDFSDAELSSLLGSALEASLPEIERGKHELIVNVPGEDVRVRVDVTRIVQVLSNLLVNAAKYTPEAGHITIRAKVTGNELTVEVEDDGIGIDSKELPNIFGMFIQVSDGPMSDRGGLGVGLALVERLVQLHGGLVTVSSGGLGFGSLFTVRLPVVVSDDSVV